MKDAYYFPHDSNAKDDPKCIMLIEELGLEGYGIFWTLIETLRDQPEYKAPMAMLPALARRYNSSGEKFKAVVTRYGLFEVGNDEFFYSKSFSARMGAIDLKRKELSEAGKRGNAIRWQSGGESGGDRVAIAIKEKEIKGKEIKGKQNTQSVGVYPEIPTIEDCKTASQMMGKTSQDGEDYFHFRASASWCIPRGKEGIMHPIGSWRSDMAYVYRMGWLENKRAKNASEPMSTREQFANYGDSI
jgi:hypothetical protein